jgi:hypothetical protein
MIPTLIVFLFGAVTAAGLFWYGFKTEHDRADHEQARADGWFNATKELNREIDQLTKTLNAQREEILQLLKRGSKRTTKAKRRSSL